MIDEAVGKPCQQLAPEPSSHIGPCFRVAKNGLLRNLDLFVELPASPGWHSSYHATAMSSSSRASSM